MPVQNHITSIILATLFLGELASSAAEPAAAPTATPAKEPEPLAADIRDMTNPTYLIDLANVHMKYGDIQRAQPLLKKALATSKDIGQRESALQTLRSTFQRTGNWKAAIEVYQDLLQSAANASERGKINFALADAYSQNHDPDKAEALLQDVAKPNKERADDQAQRQNAMQRLIQLWQANPTRVDPIVTEAEANLVKNPDDEGALEMLIQIYSFIRHDVPKLNAYTEKLAALKPNDVQEQRKLAILYLQSKQYDKAIDVYKKLMTVTARREDVRSLAFQIGNLLFQSGKKDESVAWMKENFATGITSSGDFMLLASYYERLDMSLDAEATLFQWASNAKTPDEQGDAKMRMADVALRRKDYEHADDVSKMVLKEFKDLPAIVARANTMINRIKVEKQKAVAAEKAGVAEPVVKPVVPGQPVAPVTAAEVKPPAPVAPVDTKPLAPPTNAQMAPTPVKVGADNKPAPAAPPVAPAPDAKR